MLLCIPSSILWRGQRHPTPVLLPGKSHGQRSLVGCIPRGYKESDTTERLHFHFSLSCIGEGNGNPLQCSCRRIPGTGEPGGPPSMGSHRVGHDWNDLAAAGAALFSNITLLPLLHCSLFSATDFFVPWGNKDLFCLRILHMVFLLTEYFLHISSYYCSLVSTSTSSSGRHCWGSLNPPTKLSSM